MMKRIRILNCIIAGIVILNSIGVEVALAADVQNYTVQSNDITQAIEFDAQPEDVVCAGAGEKVSFSVSARGTGLKYQWQYKMSGSNSWINFSSATEATLNKTAGEWDGWKVHCIVTDITGNSLASEEATIHFESKLKITGQPKDVTVSKAGDRVEFAVSAEGDGLKYQWQYKAPGSSSWTNFANATGATLKKVTGEWDGWKVHCVVTDKNGNSVTTEEVAIHFGSKLKITSQPKDVTVSKAGDRVEFAVSAEGDGLKYQWQYRTPGSSRWTNFANATGATLKKVTGEWDGWKVRCVVTDKEGKSETSKEAQILFATPLKITKQPTTLTFQTPGDIIEMEIVATGTNLKYQWQYKPSWASTWSNFENADTALVQKEAQAGWNGWSVRCVITDAFGNTVTSDEVKIVNTGKEDAEVYNVTFDANGGYFVHEDGTETSTVQTTADSELPVLFYEYPIIDDDTKVFGGWYDNKACTGKAIGEKENYVDKDTTFYAKWVDACVVTFEGNGGTFDDMPRFDAKVPKNSSLSNNTIDFDPNGFAHLSKTLAGWSTDPDGKNMISDYELYRTKFTENTTFYAQWRDAVVVTYDANGGYIEWTGEETYQLVTSDFVYPKYLETYSVLSDEKKVFDGWYEDQACTKPAKEKYLPDKNYTFYAKWTDAVEITYNGNGGEVLGEEQHVQKYKKNTFNYYAYANKEGSYFDGWFLDKACTKRVSEGTNRAFMDKDLVLYAGYVDTYTFTYDANGGYFNDNQQKTMVNTVKKGETEYISDYLQLYNRNKSLAFDGWYMDKELTQPAGDRCKMTKDTTVYAKWSPACIITFDPNGGKIYGWSGAAQFSVLKGRTFNQNFYMNLYSDDSYVVFDGWYYDKEGTKAVDFLNDTWTKDTTVYAKWSKTCGITYDANGGYFPSELTTTRLTEEKVVGGMLLGTPAPESLDNKMLFAGWYTDKALTQPLDEENYVVKGVATFYAKYVRGNVVTFDTNGGYITDSQETTKTVTLEKESALSEYMAPKVSGNGNKVAIGWSTEKDGSNIIEDLDSFVPEKDTTLYAVWEEGYTITFDGNGGYLSTDHDDSQVAPSIKAVCKKNIAMYKVGFPSVHGIDANLSFAGWYKDKECTESIDTRFDVVDKDMTIYAKWEKTVKVTFDANGWYFKYSNPYTMMVPEGTVLDSRYLYNLSNISAVDGKAVSGWYLNSECTEDSKVDLNTYVVNEAVTFYAKWEKGIVITYDACGGYFADYPGSTSGKSTMEYTIKKGDSLSGSYATPYSYDVKKTFAGWYTDKTYKNKVEELYNYVPKDDMTLYAKWEDACVVTFDAGEGYFSEGPGQNHIKTTTQTVSKGSNINYFPSCYNTDETKVFAGWYKESTYETPVSDPRAVTVTEDLTLYAKWETGIKLILDACGGNFDGNETKTIYVAKGSAIGNNLISPDSDDEHKRFDGWYRDEEYTQPVYWGDDTPITQDTTLYAKWDDLVKVTLDANGGYFNNNTQNIKQDQYVSKNIDMTWDLNHNWVPNNTDAHKAFDGWYHDSACTEPVGDSYIPVEGDIIYAKWTEGYRITLDAGEGYFPDSPASRKQYSYITVKKGANISSFSYTNPYHNTKGFAGWCVTSDCKEVINDFYNYKPEKDMTLYAKWVNKYRVTYDACGGYFRGDKKQTSITYDMNEGTCLTNEEPSNADAHKAFDGWYLDKNYTQKIEKMSDYYPKENMTIYAKWTDAYKVTYDACGGTFGGTDQTYMVSVKKGNTVNSVWTPSYEGKEFEGWYLDAAYTKPVGNVYEYVPKEDTTFYAKWSETYKITYDACGGYFGSADTTVSTYYIKKGDTITYRSSTPDRNISDKKAFEGWYLDAEYTKPVEDLYNYVPEKDTTFYAKWSDGYMITFDAGEGYYSNGADENSQYSYKIVKKGEALKDLSYDNPHHDNKMFEGWCLTSDCLNTLENAYDYVPEKDTTLYAKWANQFSITYDACGGYFWGDQSYTVHTTTVKEGSTLYDYEPSNADERKAFDGWYLDATYEHKINNMNDYAPENDMTVYAKWVDKYKLTYDACGGSFWNNENTYVDYVKPGDAVRYHNPSVSNGNKAFLGWYLDAEYTQPVEDIYNYVPEKDTIFYAKWEEDTSSDEDDTAFVSSQSATDSSDEAITQKPTEESTTSDASTIESTEPTATPTPEVTEAPETAVEEDQNTESEIPDTVDEENETAEETISEQGTSVQEDTVTENN